MMTEKERSERTIRDADAMRAGGAAAAGLKEALARVGVVIPSLRMSTPVSGNAFVELGGCGAGVATKLAEVINTAADELPELRVTDQ